jgi:hypothetical protein
MTTPRTHDDGRNDKQRAQAAREQEAEHERSRERDQRPRQGDRRTSEQEPRDFKKAEGEERDHLLEEKPFDFIERTRPEDKLDQTRHPGQLTRDNVNPAIPSVRPEETGDPLHRVLNPGGIVDPKTLGMESRAGTPPPEPEAKPEQWPSLGLDHTKNPADQIKEAENRQRQAKEGSGGLGEQDRLPSINEPPGSRIFTGEDGPNQIPEGAALPPLVLTSIEPDVIPVQPEEITSTKITLTGENFTPNCVVLFDDEEVPTTVTNTTTMEADVPIAPAPGTYDVEVQRGDDLSDVLVFEIAAAGRGTQAREKQKPKPKKSEPAHKRQKGKQKGKR